MTERSQEVRCRAMFQDIQPVKEIAMKRRLVTALLSVGLAVLFGSWTVVQANDDDDDNNGKNVADF